MSIETAGPHAVPAVDGTDNNVMSDVIGNRLDGHLTVTLAGRLHMLHDHAHKASLVIPTGAAAITLTAGSTSAWALGSFAVMASSGTITSDYDIHFVNVEAMSAISTYEVVLYGGADTAEVEIGRIRSSRLAGQTISKEIPIQTPIQLATTQLKAKVMSDSGAADTVDLSLHYHIY